MILVVLNSLCDMPMRKCNCIAVQILVVDNAHSQLVTCGTAIQGTCQSRSLFNISFYETNAIPESRIHYGFVASTDPTHPAVAFVAPGPSNNIRLYVGINDSPLSPTRYYYRQYTCGVSSRYLSGDDIFQIPEPDIFDQLGQFAQLAEEAATSQKFWVKYVTGFSVGGYSYFLTTQPAEYSSDGSITPTVSKLSQVCQNDSLFDSYVEMQINCQSDSRNYSFVRAATLLRPGSRLATALGVSATEHLLVAAFYDESDSALCVYRLSDIRRRFTENIQACYDSASLPVGRQFRGSKQCTPDPQVRQHVICHVLDTCLIYA